MYSSCNNVIMHLDSDFSMVAFFIIIIFTIIQTGSKILSPFCCAKSLLGCLPMVLLANDTTSEKLKKKKIANFCCSTQVVPNLKLWKLKILRILPFSFFFFFFFWLCVWAQDRILAIQAKRTSKYAKLFPKKNKRISGWQICLCVTSSANCGTREFWLIRMKTMNQCIYYFQGNFCL